MALLATALFKEIAIAVLKPLFGTSFVVGIQNKAAGWLNLGFGSRLNAFVESSSKTSTISALGVQPSPILVKYIYVPRMFVTPRTTRILDWNPLVPTSTALDILNNINTLKEEVLSGERLLWGILGHRMKVGSALDGTGFVVLGSPGSGKHTLVQHIALTLATREGANYGVEEFLEPIHLTLPTFVKAITSDKTPTLVDVLDSSFTAVGLNPQPNWFSKRLDSGRAVVLVSGFDRVGLGSDDPRKVRERVRDWIDSQITRYHKCTFIVTATPLSYATSPLRNAHVLEIQPFSDSRKEDFVRAFFDTTESTNYHDPHGGDLVGLSSKVSSNETVRLRGVRKSDHLLAILKDDSGMHDLAAWPVMLALMCVAHRNSPGVPTRDSIVDEVFSMFFEEWLRRTMDGSEGQHPILGDGVLSYGRLSSARARVGGPAAIVAAMAPLAAYMTSKRITDVTSSEVETLIRSRIRPGKLDTKGLTADAGTKLLLSLQQFCGMVVEKGSGRWSFAHPLFQDYMTAVNWWENGVPIIEERGPSSTSSSSASSPVTSSSSASSSSSSAGTSSEEGSVSSEALQERLFHPLVTDPWHFSALRMYGHRVDATPIIHAAMANKSNINALNVVVALCGNEKLAPRLRRQCYDHVFDLGSPEHHLAIAERMLGRHIQKLQRMTDTTSISSRFITNAEYLLFINSVAASSSHHLHPDHWPAADSPVTSAVNASVAVEPVSGLRSHDAQAFCDWLSERHFADVDVKYRLPTPAEAKAFPALPSSLDVGISKTLGTLSRSGTVFSVEGIAPQLMGSLEKTVKYISNKHNLPAPSLSALDLVVQDEISERIAPVVFVKGSASGTFELRDKPIKRESGEYDLREFVVDTPKSIFNLMAFVNSRERDPVVTQAFARSEAAALSSSLGLGNLADTIRVRKITEAHAILNDAIDTADKEVKEDLSIVRYLLKATQAPTPVEGHAAIMNALVHVLKDAHNELTSAEKRASSLVPPRASSPPPRLSSFSFLGGRSDPAAVSVTSDQVKKDLLHYTYWLSLVQAREMRQIEGIEGIRLVREQLKPTPKTVKPPEKFYNKYNPFK